MRGSLMSRELNFGSVKKHLLFLFLPTCETVWHESKVTEKYNQRLQWKTSIMYALFYPLNSNGKLVWRLNFQKKTLLGHWLFSTAGKHCLSVLFQRINIFEFWTETCGSINSTEYLVRLISILKKRARFQKFKQRSIWNSLRSIERLSLLS